MAAPDDKEVRRNMFDCVRHSAGNATELQMRLSGYLRVIQQIGNLLVGHRGQPITPLFVGHTQQDVNDMKLGIPEVCQVRCPPNCCSRLRAQINCTRNFSY